jgi:hypothetical protein
MRPDRLEDLVPHEISLRAVCLAVCTCAGIAPAARRSIQG